MCAFASFAATLALISPPLMAEEIPVYGTYADATPPPPYAENNDAKPRESWRSLLHDPQDGYIDMSRWLLQHRGALFVPVIVTEPAVGNGLGVAAVFFHPPKQSDESKERGDRIPPDIYGLGGFATENGTKAFGLGGMFHFKDDTWRYAGGLAKASVNLDYYTQPGLLPSQKIGYNLDGVISFQRASRRLGLSRMFASVQWIYIDLNSRLNVDSDRQYFKPKEFAKRSSGLGLALEYDTRDNTLTPSKGAFSMIEGNFYGPGIGSDNTYQSYRAHTFDYLPLAKDWVLGLRGDYRAVRGDVPFYQLPYIDLRGIASGRYQDQNVAMVEAELRWNFTTRWALLAFGGAGRAWGRRLDFDDATTETTKGLGIRYLIARQLGLYAGLDWAWGPGDHAYYIQVGSAWR
ncbi:BamA/TamA family outer membrane protein [Dyella sp. 20L07]|uniref:BamA/TamA family outer membrane protein n=1 Tax=Dyella sp. 20L07 TaxID=3384240 RepID=UPI003D279140